MAPNRLRQLIGAALFLVTSLSTALYAQNTRSAVSITGTDAATCTVPDPCRTFGVALSRTNAGGEIIAVTSGGYGPFTIDRAVTVAAAPGVYAAIALNGLGSCIDVNPGAGAKVVIRGLALYGFGVAQFGIRMEGSGEEIHVENCLIDGIGNGNGILGHLNFTVTDTVIRACRSGIWANAPVKGTVERVQIYDTIALYGILSAGAAVVEVRDSASIRSAGYGFSAADGGKLFLENCLSVGANRGINGEGLGGVVRISNCIVTDNEFGVVGTVETFGNNKIRGNTTDINNPMTPVSTR